MMSYSTINPNLQVAWDATSLAAFRRCPRYYQYNVLEGWRTPHENDDITFDTIYHEALEKYDKARGNNLAYRDSVRIAVRHALSASGKRDVSNVFRPWATDNTAKNRFTLLRTVVWYLTQFENDAFSTAIIPDSGPAVEMSFRLPLPMQSYTGEAYVLCGHMDRVAQDGDYFQVVDRKTTKQTLSTSWFDRFSPETQMSCYSVAIRVMFNTENVRALVDAAQVAVNFSRFVRGSTGRTKAQMDEWVNDSLYWIKRAEDCAKDGYWPQNDQACGLYGKCKFRDICSLDPASRHIFLKSKFVQHERWDPLHIRGD